MYQVTTHPPHIVDIEMNLSPSSFIPLCMFGGNEKDMGVKIEQFSTPVCNSFRAKILNDQLCYEVDVSRLVGNTSEERTRQFSEGLILVIDNNEDLQIRNNMESEVIGTKDLAYKKLGK